MPTYYAVIIKSDTGLKQVCTQDLSGNPIRNAVSACRVIEGFKAAFPMYEYDWAPITMGPKQSFVASHIAGDPPNPACMDCDRTDCEGCEVPR